MRLECELAAVAAVPSERSTVKAAARCLKASVSGPPPATSNSRRSSTIDAYVLPDPDTPATQYTPSTGIYIYLIGTNNHQ